jgi:flagellar biosynthesis/type III secretory pathway M-ring protein FliF/YscJ
MRTFSLQKKLVLFIFGILLVMLLIIFLIVIPSLKNITELRDSISQTEAYIEERHLKTQHMQKSVRRLDEVEAQAEKFYDVTVPLGQELRIITQLEKIAADSQITQNLDISLVDSTNADPAKAKSAEATLPTHYKFSFVNEGTFQNHLAYLKALEHLPYYVIIEAVRWENKQPIETEATTNNITIKFDAIIYVSS